MLTSVHTVWDTRIYHREARSLAQAGYDVTIIATGVNSQKASFENANIVGLKRPKWRLGRAMNWLPFIRSALKTRADIYHFHDPDLLFVGLLLQKLTRRPVVYDGHDPYEVDVLTKQWLPHYSRPLVSLVYKLVERWITKHLSAVIVANDRQLLRHSKATLIRNLPWRGMASHEPRERTNRHQAIYVGLINEVRGAWNMLEAMDKLANPASELVLVGRIDTPMLEQEMKTYLHAHGLDRRVKLLGPKPYEALDKCLTDASVGLIAFEDVLHHHIIIPTKLFEYMAFGLPVVASDLPPIRTFVDKAKCGILVPPSDISGLAAAMEYIFTHPAEARQLGENGRRAVLDRYNWETEERKLLSLYDDLLS